MPDALTFITELMSGYPDDREDLRLELRPLRPKWFEGDTDAWKYRNWFPLFLPHKLASNALFLADRYDVYMGVLPRIGRHGGRYDVHGAAWLWCDVDADNGTTEDCIALVKQSSLPRPHMAVKSGSGGIHCYWKLREMHELSTPAACGEFKDTLKRLVRCVGGKAPNAHADSTRADTASILRVPDTLNHKDKYQSKPVRFISYHPNDKAFPYSWWGANLPSEPVTYSDAPKWKPRLPGEVGKLPDEVMLAFSAPTAQGQRHTTLRRALAVARLCGFDAYAVEMLGDTFAAINPDVKRSWLQGLVRDTNRRIHPTH